MKKSQNQHIPFLNFQISNINVHFSHAYIDMIFGVSRRWNILTRFSSFHIKLQQGQLYQFIIIKVIVLNIGSFCVNSCIRDLVGSMGTVLKSVIKYKE